MKKSFKSNLLSIVSATVISTASACAGIDYQTPMMQGDPNNIHYVQEQEIIDNPNPNSYIPKRH